jgi:hypothetical protein
MESARSGDFATPELHHPSGHDPIENGIRTRFRDFKALEKNVPR